jgi:hypothetical protein
MLPRKRNSGPLPRRRTQIPPSTRQKSGTRERSAIVAAAHSVGPANALRRALKSGARHEKRRYEQETDNPC